MQSAELARASNLLIWNRWFLRLIGLWPSTINQPMFVFSTIYLVYFCIMEMCYLFVRCDILNCVVMNLLENVLFVMITAKIVIIRRGCGILGEFLKSIEGDFTIEAYDNAPETNVYLRYNDLGLKFIKISISNVSLSAILYYFQTFIVNWSAMMSGNFSYQLPYMVYPFFEINNMFIYTCFYVFLMFAVLTIICGYAAIDSFVISMIFHVCGQFAALSCRIDNLLKDQDNYRCHVTSIVLRHLQLITLAENLERTCNLIFFAHSLGTIFLLCLTLYMVNSNSIENVNVLTYTWYTFCLLAHIWGYCYTGECLIAESSGVRDAFYKSDWYNHPPIHSQLIRMCMFRAEKPTTLTVGKFCVLSLSTFTNIIKTSMAYLSVLRNCS